ncbi:unnamed protein product [Trichogramma brassicae]|uniref:Uncharacterized protein n=1 Tax=Trichogramma brassicae TaxID=86971 RepID=A0A6H5I818_9HYME|nr:unnamed protein product [Trichogramma brassicae]
MDERRRSSEGRRIAMTTVMYVRDLGELEAQCSASSFIATQSHKCQRKKRLKFEKKWRGRVNAQQMLDELVSAYSSGHGGRSARSLGSSYEASLKLHKTGSAPIAERRGTSNDDEARASDRVADVAVRALLVKHPGARDDRPSDASDGGSRLAPREASKHLTHVLPSDKFARHRFVERREHPSHESISSILHIYVTARVLASCTGTSTSSDDTQVASRAKAPTASVRKRANLGSPEAAEAAGSRLRRFVLHEYKPRSEAKIESTFESASRKSDIVPGRHRAGIIYALLRAAPVVGCRRNESYIFRIFLDSSTRFLFVSRMNSHTKTCAHAHPRGSPTARTADAWTREREREAETEREREEARSSLAMELSVYIVSRRSLHVLYYTLIIIRACVLYTDAANAAAAAAAGLSYNVIVTATTRRLLFLIRCATRPVYT